MEIETKKESSVLNFQTGATKPKLDNIYVKRICSEEEKQKIIDKYESSNKQAIEDFKNEHPNLYEDIIKVANSKTEVEHSFPASLKSELRKIIHAIADILEITHDSKGKGKKRHIVISNKGKPTPKNDGNGNELMDTIFCNSYIGINGKSVQYFAEEYKSVVPKEYLKKREDRDGSHFHITLVNKKDLESIVKKLKEEDEQKYSAVKTGHIASTLMRDMSKDVLNDWKALGVGKVTQKDGNEAFYVVIEWKSLNEWRKKRNLSHRDLHITLGFKNKDIHDVCKDSTTLISK